MLHAPAAPTGKDLASPYKMRLGVWMFIFYGLIYAGFVALNLIRPLAMETVIMFGLNLAVVYGFGLIALALVLALLYNTACGKKEMELAALDQTGKE